MNDRRGVSLSARDRRLVDDIDRLTAEGAGSVDALIERLVDPSWGVRRAASAALAQLGEPAIGPMICALVLARESEARVAALIDALATSTADPRPRLEAMVEGRDAPVLCDAAQILGRRRDASAVPSLERWVTHADDNVAVAAIEALGRVGGGAGLGVVIAAASGHSFSRVFAAMDILAHSGDPRALAPLTALLGEPPCSFEAARALGRTGDLAAAAALGPCLLATSSAFVRVAAVALVEIEDHQQRRFGVKDAVVPIVRAFSEVGASVPRIARCLEGGDVEERIALCCVLGWLGVESAAPTLVACLGEAPAIARAAALALCRLGPLGESQIALALSHGTSAQRAILLPISPLGGATAAVGACLDDPDPVVRAGACETLGRIGNVSAVPALFERLLDEDQRVVRSAARALHGLDCDATERRALASARTSAPRERREAIRLIGHFGWASGLDVLVAAVSDPDERVQDSAIYSLGLIEGDRAQGSLLALSKGESARGRGSAMRALGHGPAVRATLDALTAGLEDVDAWVRYYACQALGRLGALDSIDALLPLLQDPAGQVRVAAIEALAGVSDARAVAALIHAAGASDPDARRAAVLGLGVARSELGLPKILLAIAAPESATRMIALRALAGFDSTLAEQGLVDALSDTDASVRAVAVGLVGARAAVMGRDPGAEVRRSAAFAVARR